MRRFRWLGIIHALHDGHDDESQELTALDITVKDIEAAAQRIRGQAIQTPIVRSSALDEAVGAQCFIKPENLQRTGSFKFRGAYNRLVQLKDPEKSAGVVAWSSGNHAQGVAAAAQMLQMPAAIVMPRDAPRVKLESTRAYGAEVVLYDRESESREKIAIALAAKRGATIVPSFDDPHIIAGQGTAGLELAQQMAVFGAPLDALLVCCGGGGLVAGMSVAYQALSPGTNVYAVEPEAFNDHERSLAANERQVNAPGGRSICDALLTPTPGVLTFEINRHTLSGGISVSDDAVRAAMRFAFDHLKLVVEPGGAVALAAALEGLSAIEAKRVGIVLSGGNVDPSLFQSVL